MKKKRYHGVAGTNGYGVYDDHDSISISRHLIRSFTMKSSQDLDEAKAFAGDTYRYLQDETFGIYEIGEVEKRTGPIAGNS